MRGTHYQINISYHIPLGHHGPPVGPPGAPDYFSKQRAFYRWFSFVCVGYSALDVEESCGHCTEEALQTLIGALLLNAPFAHFS